MLSLTSLKKKKKEKGIQSAYNFSEENNMAHCVQLIQTLYIFVYITLPFPTVV